MKKVPLFLGALMLVIGLVWVLQGVGLLEGSPMTGQQLWLVLGILSALIGAFLVYTGLRRSGRRPPT